MLGNGITVGALVAANPVGSVTLPGSCKFWAAPFEIGDEFGQAGLPEEAPDLEATFLGKHTALAAGAHTTIAVVATDANLTQSQAQRVAIAAHDGLARAIVPSHTPFDGDLVFAAASGTATASGRGQRHGCRWPCRLALPRQGGGPGHSPCHAGTGRPPSLLARILTLSCKRFCLHRGVRPDLQAEEPSGLGRASRFDVQALDVQALAGPAALY